MKSEKEKPAGTREPQPPLLRGKDLAYELQRRQWQRQLLGHLISGNVHYADRDR